VTETPEPEVGPEPHGQADAVPTDPVLVQRARMQRFAQTGQRFGYSLFGIAVLLFFVGFPTGFPSWLITTIIACLAVGSIVLAPAIVIGYGVKAADREDRETGHTA
jgi:hypothetical protein